MKSEALELILGKPLEFKSTETFKKKSEFFAYPNKNIYSENGIITLIESAE